ncbi:hypothetical protein N658DRAFT_348988 [Parathielavia hyrcaniae]|uniref:Uncharacterized protein n=1 Tax=Parathielavia hyrcaniae TaxID=113614 RepID=A0AAN6PT08_9PEZI|nr:hypothetical protein N658DRAFT_348988 [Parathielavia hyrcaniae]
MATGTRRSLSSFLQADDAQLRRLRKLYGRHCRQDRGPLRHRPHTRSCMMCFIVRVRMSAIARSTMQDSADSKTGQTRQEEPQTRLSDEPENPCKLGMCDTGYNNLGEPLYCECEAGEVAPAWERPSDICPRTGLWAHDTCFEEHGAFVGWDATRHRCF